MVGGFQNFSGNPNDMTWLVKVDACGDIEWQGCELPDGLWDTSTTLSDPLNIYPNPASTSIRIELPIEIKVGILEIYDMRGIQLVNRKMVGSFTDVNCEYWSEGVYLISLFVDDETIYREKIEIVK